MLDVPGRGEARRGGLYKFGRPKIAEKKEFLHFLRAHISDKLKQKVIID